MSRILSYLVSGEGIEDGHTCMVSDPIDLSVPPEEEKAPDSSEGAENLPDEAADSSKEEQS